MVDTHTQEIVQHTPPTLDLDQLVRSVPPGCKGSLCELGERERRRWLVDSASGWSLSC